MTSVTKNPRNIPLFLWTVSSCLLNGVVHATGEDLMQPPSVSSMNGVLDISLALQETTVEIAGIGTMTTRAFNGSLPGPTLRLQAGDTILLEFTNALPGGGKPFENNRVSAPDETNIHYHGLHVDGDLPSDDSKLVIKAGETFNYESSLPTTHIGGTHWLHPHRHGSTALQVGGGAASAIIVQDPPGFLPPLVEEAPEILLLIQEFDLDRMERLESSGLFEVERENGVGKRFLTVNGQYQPKIGNITAGQWYRFRIINAGWEEPLLELEIPNCEMILLAKDGVYIRDFPRPISKASIWVGGRSDVMIQCSKSDTTYTASDNLFTIETNAEASVSPTDFEPWNVEYPPYLQDLRSATPTPGCSCETEIDDEPTVNGNRFDPKATFHTSVVGSIVERLLDADDHPYHQHVYPFQVVEFDSQDDYNKDGDYHDVVAGDNVLIRYRPEEFVSKIMIHCHRLKHEDEGMMAIEQVLPMLQEDGVTPNECSCVETQGGADTDSVFMIVGIVVAGLVLIGGIWYARRRGWCCFSAEEEEDKEGAVAEEQPQEQAGMQQSGESHAVDDEA